MESESFTARLAQAFITNRETLTTAIVESCPVPMFMADEHGRWTFVNAVMLRLLCRDASELLDVAWLRALAPSSTAEIAALWESVARHKLTIHHLRVDFAQGLGGIVSGYFTVNHVHPACYVGWFVPICCTPVDCPMHGFLLKNIPHSISSGTLTPATPAHSSAR